MKEAALCPTRNPMLARNADRTKGIAVINGLPMTAAVFMWSMHAAAGWWILVDVT
jgi:hypothetical protein